MVDLSQVMQTFTLIGILVSGVIFARLAIKSHSIGSFRFQLSTFILVWVGAESLYEANLLGLINVAGYSSLGLFLHMISMALFAVFIGFRSAQFMKTKPLPSLPDSLSNKMGPSLGALDKK